MNQEDPEEGCCAIQPKVGSLKMLRRLSNQAAALGGEEAGATFLPAAIRS